MNPFWLVRMAKWARNPPSAKHVMMVFGIVALGLIILGIEWMGWWPEWATVEPARRR